MIAINMEMPKSCTTEGFFGYDHCPLYESCKYRDEYNIDYKPKNCPLVEIEPLTDSEQRIFLSAISREEKVCKKLDDEKVKDGQCKLLMPVVHSIERKVKKVLWR